MPPLLLEAIGAFSDSWYRFLVIQALQPHWETLEKTPESKSCFNVGQILGLVGPSHLPLPYKARQIVDTALALDKNELNEVISQLLSRLDAPPRNDEEAQWDAEIQRRTQASDAGQVEHIHWTDLREKLRTRFESR